MKINSLLAFLFFINCSLFAQKKQPCFTLNFSPQASSANNGQELDNLDSFLQNAESFSAKISSYTNDFRDNLENQKLVQIRLQSILEFLEQRVAPLEKVELSHQLEDKNTKGNSWIKICITINPKTQKKGGKEKNNLNNKPNLSALVLTELEKSQTQRIILDNSRAQIVKGEQGTQFFIPAQAFTDSKGKNYSGKVSLELIEIYSPAQRALLASPTVSNGQILQTGGTFYLGAKDSLGNLLANKPDKQIYASFADERQSLPDMRIYTAERVPGQPLNWQPTNDLIRTDSSRQSLQKLVLADAVRQFHRELQKTYKEAQPLIKSAAELKNTCYGLQSASDKNGNPAKSLHTTEKQASIYSQHLNAFRNFFQTCSLTELLDIFQKLQTHNHNLKQTLTLHGEQVKNLYQQLSVLSVKINSNRPCFAPDWMERWQFLQERLNGYQSEGEHYESEAATSIFWENIRALEEIYADSIPESMPSAKERKHLGAFLHHNHDTKVSLHRLFTDLNHISKELESYEQKMNELQQIEAEILACAANIDQERKAQGLIGQSDSLLLALNSEGKLPPATVFERSAPIRINVWTNCDRPFNPLKDITVSVNLNPARPIKFKLDKKFNQPNTAQAYLHATERDFTLNLRRVQGGIWESDPLAPNQMYELNLLEIKDDKTVRVYSKKGKLSQLEKAKIELKEIKISELAAFLANK